MKSVSLYALEPGYKERNAKLIMRNYQLVRHGHPLKISESQNCVNLASKEINGLLSQNQICVHNFRQVGETKAGLSSFITSEFHKL